MHTPVLVTSVLFWLALGSGCAPQALDQAGPEQPATVAAASVDVFDPRVFNWRFYLNSYADLLIAGLHDEAAARQHWLAFGIGEGRQASATFHTRQYLDLYPDLRAAFGADFHAALQHYLTHGVYEGRAGYRDGGAYGRWTVANDIISVSTSTRTAGAVDSVMWNGHEFINSWDHGRQLQVALSINGWGECDNPTEAGGSYDGVGAGSTSALDGVMAHGNHLATQSRPAFWLRPGEPHSPVPGCTVARNPTLLSDYVMNKDIQVGAGGIRHAVQFLVAVHVPEDVSSLTLEGPTGYLGGEFTAYYTEDLMAATLQRIPQTPMGEQGLPLIFATEDGSAAMGAWSPDLPQPGNPGGYGRFAFPSPDPANSTNKWNIVFRYGPLGAGTTLSQRSFLLLGSLENVRVAMKQIHDLWQAGRL